MKLTNLHCIFCVVMTLIFISFGSAAKAETKNIPLTPGSDAPKLNQYILYQKGYVKPITYDSIASSLPEFENIKTESIQFGYTYEPILIVIQVRNDGQSAGNWILTTGRKSLPDFSLYEVTALETKRVIDGNNLFTARQNIKKYGTFSYEIYLPPGGSRMYAIQYTPKNQFYLPLSISTTETYFSSRNRKAVIAFSSFFGMLVLIFINVTFFSITGKKEFIWLGLAQFFYAMYSLLSHGYFTQVFYTPNSVWNTNLSSFLKFSYVFAICIFTQKFIHTRQNFTKTNLALRSLILSSVLLIVVLVVALLLSLKISIPLAKLSWVLILITSFLLPLIAIRAAVRLKPVYWALVFAWTPVMLFIIYGGILSLNLLPKLPINWNLIGPLGLNETFFATLALGLHLNRIKQEKTELGNRLKISLSEKIHLDSRIEELKTKNRISMMSIQDQSALIHASGHDSKQVLFTLNSVIKGLEHDTQSTLDPDLISTLKSLSSYLKYIISSTLSGSQTGITSLGFVTLKACSAIEIVQPLELLYRKEFSAKGIILNINVLEDVVLISDQALLTRCLSNFLNNSLKFSETGEVILNIYQKDDVSIIEILDRGIGISKDTEKTLNSHGKSRFKLESDTSGSGSGFIYSKNTLRKLGGTVKITTRQGGGTRVVICLPKTTTLTNTNMLYLKDFYPDVIWIDADIENIKKITENTKKASIAITYDDTPLMRQNLSEAVDLVIYKPLYLETCLHPVFKKYLD